MSEKPKLIIQDINCDGCLEGVYCKGHVDLNEFKLAAKNYLDEYFIDDQKVEKMLNKNKPRHTRLLKGMGPGTDIGEFSYYLYFSDTPRKGYSPVTTLEW